MDEYISSRELCIEIIGVTETSIVMPRTRSSHAIENLSQHVVQ